MTTAAPPAASPRRRSLFDIGEDLLALDQLLAELDGDISDPKAEEAITAWFKEIGADEGRKLDGYVNLMRQWEGEGAAATAAKEQYAKIAQSRANRVKRFKERLIDHLRLTKRDKVVTVTGLTLAIQKNGGKPPMDMDVTVDPKMLPEKFQRIIVEVNTDAVRAALEAGEQLEFASLLPVGSHLRIR